MTKVSPPFACCLLLVLLAAPTSLATAQTRQSPSKGNAVGEFEAWIQESKRAEAARNEAARAARAAEAAAARAAAGLAKKKADEAAAAAAKNKADEAAACVATCVKQRKPEATCKRVCAQ